MKDFLNLLFGELSLHFYIVWFLFALFGFIVNKYIAFSNRGNTSKFNLIYFIKDNFWDLLFGFFLTFLVGRFHDDMLNFLVQVTVKEKMFIAFGFGYLYSTLFQLLRKTTLGSIFKLPIDAEGENRAMAKTLEDSESGAVRPKKPNL